MSKKNNSSGGFYILLFFIAFGIIGWLYGETDKVHGFEGGIMKIILFLAILIGYILWYSKEKK